MENKRKGRRRITVLQTCKILTSKDPKIYFKASRKDKKKGQQLRKWIRRSTDNIN